MTAADSSTLDGASPPPPSGAEAASPPRDDSTGPPEWQAAPLAVRELMARICPPGKVRLLVPTATRFDVGLWFRHRRIWLCVADERLILAAVGPRPYLQAAPFHDLVTSFYSHPSGELVLVPAGDLAVRSLVLTPRPAWRILRLIRADGPPHPATNTPDP